MTEQLSIHPNTTVAKNDTPNIKMIGGKFKHHKNK